MIDKRRFSRVTVPFDVTLIDTAGAIIKGNLHDIAIQGAFITCDPAFPEATEVHARIVLAGGAGDFHVASSAVVVRQDADGLAIRFTGIDPESIGHLRNLIAYNAEDPDAALEEIHEGGSQTGAGNSR